MKITFSSKLLTFTIARYSGYFLLFIRGILLANILAPEVFGLWGLITLLTQYLSYTNLGLNYAVNVEISVDKDNARRAEVINTSTLLTAAISILLLIIYTTLAVFKIKVEPYDNVLLPLVLFAIVSHFTQLAISVYRVEGKLLKIALDELLSAITTILIIVISDSERMIINLVYGMLISKTIALFILYYKKPFKNKLWINKAESNKLLKQGLSLLLYNLSFYLIILGGRTVIAIFYDYEVNGLFTLANNITVAILLGINAITYAIYPKLLYNFRQEAESGFVKKLLEDFSMVNSTVVYLIVYLTSSFLPFIFYFLEEYKSVIPTLNILLAAQAILISCLGYNTLAVSRKRHSINTKVGLLTIVLTFIISIIIAYLKVNYIFISLTILSGAAFYSSLIIRSSYSLIDTKIHIMESFNTAVPLSFLIPLVLFIYLSILNVGTLAGVTCLFVFISLNYRLILKSFNVIRRYIPFFST